jgi:endoglucanase
MSKTSIGRSALGSAFAIIVALGAACSDAVGPAHAEDGPVTGMPTTPANPTAPSGSNPLTGTVFFVDAFSNARRTADAWRATRPADAAQMDKLASAGQAKWFGGWNANVQADVDQAVSTAAATNALPVLVAYNIPQRDCGSYSAGGAASADGYRSWISAFARGIGARRALVILEPDALPGMDCLTDADRNTRTGLLAFAVRTLRELGALVYLDAGHSRWQSPATMASRLQAAGIEMATGFSLNVSNFHHTSDQITYGNGLSALVGDKHYVIDTSRNGLGSAGDALWCNPDGRALGERPSANTGHPLVDAFLWVKTPGESDGACNGHPDAGVWMPEYALGLARRAAY